MKAPQNVIRAGHPLLRINAQKVSSSDIQSLKTKKIINEMKQVFKSRLHPVVGLAAPQIGYSARIIGIQVLDKQVLKENGLKEVIPLKFYINPEMTILESKPKYDYESCVSVPFYSGLVKRASAVELKALDEDGKNIELKCSGFLARIVQHEIDHLDGFVFVDRMEEKSLRHDKYIDEFEMTKK
jgi:peptide deformylase